MLPQPNLTGLQVDFFVLAKNVFHALVGATIGYGHLVVLAVHVLAVFDKVYATNDFRRLVQVVLKLQCFVTGAEKSCLDMEEGIS